MAKISSLDARPIFNSRGECALEVALGLANGEKVVASVPQGKSSGSYEAEQVECMLAIKSIKKAVSPKLKGLDPVKQEDIDKLLIDLDGTPTKKRLGGNTVLGASIAILRAGALSLNLPLWKHIRKLSGLKVKNYGEFVKPRLYVNVVNGGLHAGNNLDFQEYLVIPKARTYMDAAVLIQKLYETLKKQLIKYKGKSATNVGDEGGFAPNFRNNLEPFKIIQKVVKELKIENDVDFGLDAAASNISLSVSKLRAAYKELRKDFNLFYLEDPFGENDFEEFAKLKEELGDDVLIAGDDLTTTNTERMRRAKEKGSINSVVVKPNQIGTVTEAIEAVKLAREFGWAVVVSHRSGETNDDFIADFAYGVGADGFKLGAPVRGERVAKYNRLLKIETEVK